MPTDHSLHYALVTGAGSGLGRAFSLRLAREGWHVGVTDIDPAASDQTLRILRADGGSGQAELLDVTDAQAWQALGTKLRHEWPRLDLLINNAGIAAAGEVGVARIEDLLQVVEVNLHGVLHGCHTMVPWLKETAPGGHVVNIASILGAIAPPTMTAYSASKAAVIAFSESLHGELIRHGIGVTVVVPGFFSTRLLDRAQFTEDAYREIAQRYTSQTRLTAEQVVSQTLSAIAGHKLYAVAGYKARWYWRLKRLFPTVVTEFVAKRLLQHLRERSADHCSRPRPPQ
ncbi:MAG: SDR family NAD(P)-dependent oxidoreductase [Pirellulales bacterium]|nr:SDR family NAD(P)-dependent oxidoreductase [Pirellulales bacterium]